MNVLSNREIGSEFWEVPTLLSGGNEFFSPDTVWFLSGRSALSAIVSDILKKRGVKNVALPALCCDSMITPFLDAGLDVKFYPVYSKDGALVKDVNNVCDCDVLFLMDYFGYADDCDVNFDGIKIRDLTHTLFSKTYDDSDYYFGSLRKWAGFLTGGFARGVEDERLPTDEKYVAARKAAMQAKERYINGCSQSKDYLAEFSAAEEHLEECAVAGAALCDVQMASRLDIDKVRETRRKNAAVLLRELSDIAIFPNPKTEDVPMFVPILVPNGKRDALRRHLIEREIYCPVHWPLTKFHNIDEKTKEVYENELSIVCDQRYDESDMERIVKAIREF